MKGWMPAIAGALLLTACSPSHQFTIESDEPIQNVEVDLLNARTSEATIGDRYRAKVRLWVGDSSGEIRVIMAGGRRVTCRLGYITNGIEQPNLTIEEGHCHQVRAK